MLTLLYIIDTICEYEMEAEKISLDCGSFPITMLFNKDYRRKVQRKNEDYLQIYKYLIKPRKPFK